MANYILLALILRISDTAQQSMIAPAVEASNSEPVEEGAVR